MSFRDRLHPILTGFPAQVVFESGIADESKKFGTAHPQLSAAIFMDGMHCNRRNALRVVHPLQTIPGELKQSVVGAHPDLSLRVLIHNAHEAIGQAVFGGECTKNSIAIADQSAAFHSNPERVIASDSKAKNVVIAECGRVFAVESQEPLTVETDQPACRTDPQISVRSLRKRLHDLLR